jgi:hypothetical protein
VYAEALRERASEGQRLVGLRLQQAAEYHARERNRLTLFQATLVGALVAGVGAIQALNPEVNLREDLRWPLVALFAATVLAVPYLILNWPERYRWRDYTFAAVLGACVLWLIAWLASDQGVVTVLMVAAGAAFVPSLAWLLEKTVAARDRHWLPQDPEWRWVGAIRHRLEEGARSRRSH